jgi:hypothetical protein
MAAETLERRTLLFTPWTLYGDLSGNITFEEDPASTSNDTVVLAINAAGRLDFEFSGSEYDPFDVDFDISVLRSVTVLASGGSDQLVLDFVNGSPVPADGIGFSGGEGGNSMGLRNYDAAAIDLVHQGIDSATLRVDEGPVISYSQTESLTLEGVVADLLIDLSQTGQPNPDVVVTTYDFLVLTPSAITGSTFGSTWLANPTDSLTIDLQASGVGHADSIRVESFSLSVDTDLILLGDDEDTVEFWGPENVGPTIRDLTVTAGTIDIRRTIELAGGASLAAGGDITFHDSGGLRGSGDGVLVTAGGDVQLDANVLSEGGRVSLAAGGDVWQNANITTLGVGTISVTGEGDITMAPGSNTVSVDGQITYDAVGDLDLAVVRTTGSGSISFGVHVGTLTVSSTVRVDVGGNLSLAAAGGSIVLESSARLQTAGGVLSLESGRAISMSKGSLVGAGGGDVSLTAQFGVLVGRIVSPGATITIDAGLGGIADGADPADPPDADGADIEADKAELYAYGSIGSRAEDTPSGTVVVGLDTKVNRLDAVSENGVGIFIVNDGPLVFDAEARRLSSPKGIVDITVVPPAAADEVFRHIGRTKQRPRNKCQEPFVQSTRRAGPRQVVPDTFFSSNPNSSGDNRFDINGDGVATALDALILVDELNRNSARKLNHLATGLSALDVNRDGLVSPQDLLQVIGHLNRQAIQPGSPGEYAAAAPRAEGEAFSPLVSTCANTRADISDPVGGEPTRAISPGNSVDWYQQPILSASPGQYSYPHEDLLAVHPQTDQPETEPGQGRLDHRLVHRTEKLEDVLAQVNLQRPLSPWLQQHAHAVHGDRIHPHDHQRECPAAVAEDIDQAVQRGQDQAAPTGGEEGPRRCPDAFDHRTDGGQVQ